VYRREHKAGLALGTLKKCVAHNHSQEILARDVADAFCKCDDFAEPRYVRTNKRDYIDARRLPKPWADLLCASCRSRAMTTGSPLATRSTGTWATRASFPDTGRVFRLQKEAFERFSPFTRLRTGLRLDDNASGGSDSPLRSALVLDRYPPLSWCRRHG
jgi:hypothetical protein